MSQIELADNPGDLVSGVFGIFLGGTRGQSITAMEAPRASLAPPQS